MKSFWLICVASAIALGLFCPQVALPQRITGTVTAADGSILPFASILIKKTSRGAAANQKGVYALNLTPGTYTLVCQNVGYAAQEKNIRLLQDTTVNFVLVPLALTLEEVIVSQTGENPAYAIMRQAIQSRSRHNNEVSRFSCDFYSKDLIRLNRLPNRVMGQKVPEQDRARMALDSNGMGIIYLSEALSKVYVQKPDRLKVDVLSSRVSGSNGFGFTFPVFINLYQSQVQIFDGSINQRGFISPLSDGALRFYKFRMIGTFEENGQLINSIRVMPKRNYEPLFNGVINIVDGDWRIHSFDLWVSRVNQLEVLDTLRVKQLHIPVSDDAWQVKNQELSFHFNSFGIDASGRFYAVYSDYRINAPLPDGIFDKVIIRYDTAVNKRPLAYWDSIRPVRLEPEEYADFRKKDSLRRMREDSASIWNRPDSLRKRQGPFKPLTLLFPGVDRTHYGNTYRYTWGINSLLNNAQYNTAEGFNLQVQGFFRKKIRPRTTLMVEPLVRYGFANQHLNPQLAITHYRKSGGRNGVRYQTWFLSAGSRVSQYNKDIPVLPITNTFSTLENGKNVMKTYENQFVELLYGRKTPSGLKYSVHFSYEDRRPLDNVTQYTLRKRDTINITPNFPSDRVSVSDIVPHKSLLLEFAVSYKPGVTFIQFPESRIALDSKYPEITFRYTRGISGILGSVVRYDKWRVEMDDEMNLKLAGQLKYRLGAGGFLNRDRVYVQDYHHVIGNSLLSATPYVNSFQLISSYEFSNDARFMAYAHLEHHLNGLLTNKIPFMKKLNWNLVVGGNALTVPGFRRYAETFVGLENILKICRIDWVVSFRDGFRPYSAIVVGADGLLNTLIRTNVNKDNQNPSKRVDL